MAVGIAAFFDLGSEKRLIETQNTLAKSDVRTPWQVFGIHPHLTLSQCDNLDYERFRDVLATFAEEYTALDFALTSVGIFPIQGGSIFLAPIITSELLAFHRILNQKVVEFGGISSIYTSPGHWVPHCSITVGVESRDLPRVLEVCQAELPITGRIERIGLAEYSATTLCERYQFNLRKNS